MAAGWIYRRNHDLCARCFREASAASARRWRNLPGLPFDAAPLRAA
jgi:hypothetical protein